MTALTADRNTQSRIGNLFVIPAAASKIFYGGALLCVNAAGYGVPGATATGLRGIGRVSRKVASGETAGEELVEYERGIFAFANSSSADLITRADISKPAYVVDDQTVAKTDGTGTRSVAGTIVDVDGYGVWIGF